MQNIVWWNILFPDIKQKRECCSIHSEQDDNVIGKLLFMTDIVFIFKSATLKRLVRIMANMNDSTKDGHSLDTK